MASQRKKEQVARRVALALAKAYPLAGQLCSVTEPQSAKERAANMLRDGPYGAYVVAGDPHQWSGGEPFATIYMETKGHLGDCEKPLDYWGNGMDVAFEASQKMTGYYIEFCNAAIAHVWAE